MGLQNLAQPRFVLAAIGLIIVGVLVALERIEPMWGLLVIVGVLAAFGAWKGVGRLTGGGGGGG